MKNIIQLAFFVITMLLSTSSIAGEREKVLSVIKQFYIGDHEGSGEARKASMHENGAYRYVDKEGNYKESKFRFKDGNADKSYKEEILSIDIYDTVALVNARLEFNKDNKIEYKLITLHKTSRGWLITGISWGFGNNLL